MEQQTNLHSMRTLHLGWSRGTSAVSSIPVERSYQKEHAENNYYEWPDIYRETDGSLQEQT